MEDFLQTAVRAMQQRIEQFLSSFKLSRSFNCSLFRSPPTLFSSRSSCFFFFCIFFFILTLHQLQQLYLLRELSPKLVSCRFLNSRRFRDSRNNFRWLMDAHCSWRSSMWFTPTLLRTSHGCSRGFFEFSRSSKIPYTREARFVFSYLQLCARPNFDTC